ncbi:MAG: hypothetical protein AAGL29_09555, partial [Bacteroidota bacterium]
KRESNSYWILLLIALMKGVLLYIATGVSIILLINIIRVLTIGLNRLSEYGYGYLVGKATLLVIFTSIVIILKKHKSKSRTQS